MTKPHRQESAVEHEADVETSANDDEQNMSLNLDSDDDFTDDWINHVDDYDSSDSLNDW